MLKRKKAKFFVIVPCLVLIGGGAYYAYMWATRPVVSQGVELAAGTEDKEPALTPSQVSTSLYTTQLAGSLEIKKNDQKPQAQIVSRLLASSRQADMTHAGDLLAITVGRIPAGGIDELSDIMYRQRSTGLYAVSSLDFVPKGAEVYVRYDPYEISVFWPHNAYYVSVVASGTADRSQTLRDNLKMTFTNWQWK